MKISLILALIFVRFSAVPALTVYMKIHLGQLKMLGYEGSCGDETVLCSFTYDKENLSDSVLRIRETYQGRTGMNAVVQYNETSQRQVFRHLERHPEVFPLELYLAKSTLTPSDAQWGTTGVKVVLDKSMEWTSGNQDGSFIELKRCTALFPTRED